jgi:hypothetical protein
MNPHSFNFMRYALVLMGVNKCTSWERTILTKP